MNVVEVDLMTAFETVGDDIRVTGGKRRKIAVGQVRREVG